MSYIVRARHVLCILGHLPSWHSGNSYTILHQYEERFMKDVHGILRCTTTCDSICEQCPHCILDHCQYTERSYTEYKEKDEYIVQRCGIDVQMNYRLSDIVRRMYTVFTKKDMTYLCHQCQFSQHCMTYYAILHKE